MSTLPAAPTTTHWDAATDDPKQARGEAKSNFDILAALITTLGGAGNPLAINGTVGATTPASGAFTTISSSGAATLASASVTGNATVTGMLGIGGAAATGSKLTVFGLARFGPSARLRLQDISGDGWIDTTASGSALYLGIDGSEAARIHTNRGVTIGSPTGGSQGFGTLNAEGLFINGVVPGSTLPAGYMSAEQTITLGGSLTLTHGLGATPLLLRAELICKTAEHGYSVGDQVPVGYHGTALNAGVQLTVTTTSIKVQIGANNLCVLNSSGIAAAITLANWRLAIRAWI